MEPDVIRMYSSSPPPMEDGAEEDEDEFGDFGTFSGVPGSISFSELDTPTTFNQSQALTATSPPELLASRGLGPELSRVNGVVLGDDPSSRTEVAKVISCSLDYPVKNDCNGGGSGGLTNGFESFDDQGTPPPRDPVLSTGEGLPLEDTGSPPAGSPENDFADFAAFSEDCPFQVEDGPAGGHLQVGAACQNCQNEQGGAPEDTIRDTDGTGSEAEPELSCPAEAPASPPQEDPPAVNGLDGTSEGGGDQTESRVSPDETETSLGRPLSTDALEEYGDMSTTCSAPSPPIQGDTPTDSSQLAEDGEDFGDFGDPGSFATQGFAEFEPSEAERDDDFGDFNSPKFQSPEDASAGAGSSFPVSDSFGNFSSAEGGDTGAGWSAFGEPEEVEGETWAEFSVEPTDAGMQSQKQTDNQSAPPSSRLDSLFRSCFPTAAARLLEQQVEVLTDLLDTADPRPEPGPGTQEEGAGCRRCGGVWSRLRDVHEALGLRYQWGGSHCNKALLGCLGIDTRNILFTGQKKQPVIVPMYAAGLGMLEPTKEPVKPVSAAEMITSIGQVPVEDASCPPDSVQQEALPPIQFDWSSSGLTNPLDASGGSALLNLDFFGPVEDSGSTSSASIPGVDPELFELTTSKLDSGSSSSRVADAFARLMSTVEKTSTSTRKPKKDENLSEEAAKVIAALPDLSFMHAKVLMFPATLMPLCSQATPD
ncbi:hypothetical protein OJAV_G00012240 [Oryzias javanicus]|uniref:Aftiphilin clathrin-binding box domain-containing protein n=1 Tax=Oryzias javanicus TaxID=123683 RepID=A0A3S2MXF2_ORYJA|nr:hypothetical protein OJAV_G00012240 [Oryzias javanicus]